MSLVWNILSKIGENFPDGRFPEEGQKALSLLWTPPLRFFLERWDCGVEESINFADLPGWVGCEVWDEEVQSQADCEYPLDRV